MKSIKQLPKWSWVVLIVAVVAGVFIWHKNSADSNLIDNVKFSFSGYNESGTVVAVIPPEDEKKIAIMQLDYLSLNCQIKLEKNYLLICNVLHEYF